MKKTLLELYAMAICFVATCAAGVALCYGLYSIVVIARPDITIGSYKYSNFENNDTYWESIDRRYGRDEQETPRPPEVELTKKRIEAREFAYAGESREGLDCLIRSLITIFSSLLIFLIHWRIAKVQRQG